MRFITIVTKDYALHANRLSKSILKKYPSARITVYVAPDGVKDIWQSKNIKVRSLDEIHKLGVKRAKFFAYADAARNGEFIYLDADILVVNPLPELLNAQKLTACRDDLRECPFISNPSRPWESSPELSGEKYFNSGVFAAPAGCSSFFDAIRDEAINDDEWRKFTVKGKLYDNHFLCAKVVQHNIPINFISEYEYNWQGFRSFGDLNCYVDDSGNLRNRVTGSLLRVVHFAGINDIDAYIAGVPPDIARILAGAIGDSDFGVLELINSALNVTGGLEPRLKTVMAQGMCQSLSKSDLNPGAEIPMVGFRESIASIVYSVQEADFIWNDLKCGSAYLSAAEYQRLRSFITDASVRAILEFGAGYTTALFARLGCKQVALEGWDGSWLAFARAQGADARLVAFTPCTGFDEIGFMAGLDEAFSGGGKKMIFIDSPPGTANRSCLLEQVLKLARDADFYVIHDSVRDSSLVYKLSSDLGLVVIEHFPSLRGLTFLGKPYAYSIKPQISQRALKERVARMRFDVRIGEKSYASTGNLKRVFIHLINTGKETITAAGDDLRFSMHLVSVHDEVIQWDTPRYRLPVDIYSTDRLSFWVEIGNLNMDGAEVLFDYVKEGEFWWSNIAESPCPRLTLGEL